VRQLAAQGTRVAAVARRRDRLEALRQELGEHVLPFQHDVTSFEETPALFQEITKQLGGLDLVVYSSGVMPEVGPDEFNFEKDRQMIDVNITGAVAWLNLAAERFQAAKTGTIIGIGSVAGDRGRRGQPVYNASKAFLATYLEALRNRLSQHGVRVVTIKPGPVLTEMTSRLNLKKALPAEQAAALILKKSQKAGEHYLLLPHRVIFAVIRNIPSPIFRRLKL
jgi:decaprenylphospho-beta-D-erythro-pentofuranosid-2-ulose 2-reductase